MSPRACRATAFRDAFSFCFLVAAYRCSGVGALPVCVCVCGHARLAVRRKPIELSEKYIGMSGATIFAELMKEHEVDHIFGYPGGAILPVFDAIHDAETFKFILTRTCLVRAPGCPLCRSPAERFVRRAVRAGHEQGAGHAAQGYARVTGKPGIVLVTSGPGACIDTGVCSVIRGV